jgi:hypothetical protein
MIIGSKTIDFKGFLRARYLNTIEIRDFWENAGFRLLI